MNKIDVQIRHPENFDNWPKTWQSCFNDGVEACKSAIIVQSKPQFIPGDKVFWKQTGTNIIYMVWKNESKTMIDLMDIEKLFPEDLKPAKIEYMGMNWEDVPNA